MATNLTAGELLKIGNALEHKIVSLSDSIDFKIQGGKNFTDLLLLILLKMEPWDFCVHLF